MCGIAGELHFNNEKVSLSSLKTMQDALRSRGPDESGVFIDGARGFAHTRLSIIDLSSHSSQPMIDDELGLGIVFNGEIYNYRDLRRELEQAGYRFSSQGDTEVILKSYHAWGENCLQRFHGMFAIAIWEKQSGRVFLARDRLGIKPLYYSQNQHTLRFASNLPALLHHDNASHEIDPIALNYYMSFHSVVPAPHTIIKGISKLPPAHYMIIEKSGKQKLQEYWRAKFETPESAGSRTFDEWKELVVGYLDRAVQKRLVADVPVGVLLSGGVDSSLIVSLLARAGKEDIETFSIGFESAGGEAGDEFQYSDLVARTFATKHHKIFIGSDQTLSNLQACIGAMSEPMVSHDAIGFYLLSREVSKHLKVVQCGQGADELFAGYHWYPPMMEAQDPVESYAKVFFDRDFAEYGRTVHRNFVQEDYARAFVSAHFSQPGARRAIDKALRLDTRVMLVDDPVKRVDNMTMAWGLEGRVPFLDHELVELAAQIPAEHKVPGGGKYILKEAARALLPAEVIDRPKGYFPVPGLKHIQGDYLTLIKDTLSTQKARDRGLFDQSYVAELLTQPEKQITPLRGSKLWQVAALEMWLQQNGI